MLGPDDPADSLLALGLRVGRQFADECGQSLDESRHFDSGDAPEAVMFQVVVTVRNHVALLNDFTPGDVGMLRSELVGELAGRLADDFDTSLDGRLLLDIAPVLLPRHVLHNLREAFAPVNDVPQPRMIAFIRPHGDG